MKVSWPHAALALVAAAAALFWPITSAIPARDAVQARVATAVVAALACAGLSLWRTVRQRTAVGISVVSASLGVALLLKHSDATTACVAEYEGRPVIVGTAYTPDIETYIKENPGLSTSDRLFDAAGAPERVWTLESIRSCRLLVSWAGLAAIPFLAASASALIPAGRYVLTSRPKAAAGPGEASATRPLYDAFISYRHLEPDRTYAFDIVQALESSGLRVAIDARDFSPNEHFLAEMERCIKQSRYVLCIVTAQWVQSDHTSEEAVISKTLDLADRRRRLVPLIFERVELPVWLHGLVGIDFTAMASVDPRERLLHLLTKEPREGAR